MDRGRDGGAVDTGEHELESDDVEDLGEEGLGEYLVEQGLLSPQELMEALREQAEQPGIRLSEIIAYLGYLPYLELDRLRATRW